MSEYDTLGVARDASDEDIKRSYKKLAMKYHPEREGGDTEMFKKISNAYETLSDPQKRHGIDNTRPPKQHEYTITVPMEDAFKGTTKTFRVTRQPTCKPCGGHGGTHVHIQMGPFTQTLTQQCSFCGGRGTSSGAQEELTIVLTFGAGTPDGIRYAKGDIIFTIKVAPHPVFTRRGNLLVWEKEISFEESVVGTVLQCPHFNGELQIDTAPFGVIDPRKEYQFGDVITKFNVRYPEPNVKFSISKNEPCP